MSSTDKIKPVVAGVRDAIAEAAGSVSRYQHLKDENKRLRKQLRRLGAPAPAPSTHKPVPTGMPKTPRRLAKPLEGDEAAIVDTFHVLYKDIHKIEKATYWFGTRAYKLPSDLWIYQELLHELKPDLVIETGTLHGGSALFLAHMMDLIGNGEIVTIDVSAGVHPRPQHPRITYIQGSSSDPEIVAGVAERAASAETVMALLDSDHSKTHVLDEMRAYGPLITRGSYMVVEDTNINGHPTQPTFGPGPFEAVEEYLEENSDFEIDRAREKFLVTFNPSGYLRRK